MFGFIRRPIRLSPDEQLALALVRILRAHEETSRLQNLQPEEWLHNVVLLAQEDIEWLSHPFGLIKEPGNGQYITIHDHAERLMAQPAFVTFADDLSIVGYDVQPRYTKNIRCIVLN